MGLSRSLQGTGNRTAVLVAACNYLWDLAGRCSKIEQLNKRLDTVQLPVGFGRSLQASSSL